MTNDASIEAARGFQLVPLRVQTVWMRVVFVVVFGLGNAAFGTFGPFGTFVPVLWFVLGWVVIVRSFRATGEEFTPPREWWRATFTWQMSWLLAAYIAVSVVFSFVVNVLPYWDLLAQNAGAAVLVELWLQLALSGLLAAYLVLSGAMLFQRRSR